ncbi:hypothetical protein OPV22_018669 [Ensete ventricosum]|uniref:1,2-dihydroxy-3-keto-5-methylthiopentene dioxygenase homolog n=1 Tax=Ensete ventricosum TaxID=4639 RepID=A0AAV8R0Q9_ENSVE|nr:hypothetical protein OPV22_018669 [Ensete ventricosum]
MAPEAWLIDESDEDQRLPHHRNPKEFVPLSKLQEIGVLYWHLDPKNYESSEELKKIREDRGYNYMDLLELCPGKVENYEEKLKNFYREHIHADEEIRYCLEGSGWNLSSVHIRHFKLCEADEIVHWRTCLDSLQPPSGGPSGQARLYQDTGELWSCCEGSLSKRCRS